MPAVDQAERRQHRRFKLTKEVLALSMNGMGKIEEIGQDGFCAEFTTNSHEPQKEVEVTSILVKGGFSYIKNLPVKLVWRNGFYHSPLCGLTSQRVGFQLINPNPSQKAKIDEIIKYCAEPER